MSVGPFTVGVPEPFVITYLDKDGLKTVPPPTGATAVQVTLSDATVASLTGVDPSGMTGTITMLAPGSDTFSVVRDDGTVVSLTGDVTFTVVAAAPGPAVSGTVTIGVPAA